MSGNSHLMVRKVTVEDRDIIFKLPPEGWEDMDTINEEMDSIFEDNNKAGFLCIDHQGCIVGYIGIVVGSRYREMVVVHRRVQHGSDQALILNTLLKVAVSRVHERFPQAVNLNMTIPEGTLEDELRNICQSSKLVSKNKAILLRGYACYMRPKIANMSPQAHGSTLLDGRVVFRQLFSDPSWLTCEHSVDFFRQALFLRGDLVSFLDFMDESLPCNTDRILIEMDDNSGSLDSLSFGTVKRQNDKGSSVLHLDIMASDLETTQRHIIQHLKNWLQAWPTNRHFYLEINFNEEISVSQLAILAATVGLMPPDTFGHEIKTLITMKMDTRYFTQ